MGGFSDFHLLSTPRGYHAVFAPHATKASIGAGLSSIRTMTPPGGHAGSVARPEKISSVATSAGFLNAPTQLQEDFPHDRMSDAEGRKGS